MMSKFTRSQFITAGILTLVGASIVQVLFTTPSPSAQANKSKSIDVPSDPDARHTVVSLHRDRERYWNLISLRSSKSGSLFTNIRIDCDSHRYQLLHEAQTLEAMHDQRRLSNAWRNLNERSVAFYKASYVCSAAQE